MKRTAECAGTPHDMKRSPLKRRTPLKRGSPIKRGAPPIQRSKTDGLQRNAPLAKVSAKRKKENASYTKLRKEFLAAHFKCEVCGKAQATEIHHKARRYGKWLCDVRFFLATCRTCHLKIENEGEWARTMGFLLTPEQLRLADGPSLPR